MGSEPKQYPYIYPDFNHYESEEERNAHLYSLSIIPNPLAVAQRVHPDWDEAKIKQYVVAHLLRYFRERFIEQQVYHEEIYPQLSSEKAQQLILKGNTILIEIFSPRYEDLMAKVKARIQAVLGDPPEEWYW